MTTTSSNATLPKLARRLMQIGLLSLFTLLALEGALQAAFMRLPPVIIEQMPQFQDRAGFKLDAKHGAREYPAGQLVKVMITGGSGDLYRLTCLSLDDAPPFAAYDLAFQRDSHGFRNGEPFPTQADLAIIGDSFVAAEAIEAPFWQGVSDSLLALGLPGSGTLEQRRLFDAFAAPLEPETVALAYFAGNDLADNATFLDMQASGETFASRARKDMRPWDYSVLVNLFVYARKAAISSQNKDCHYPQLAHTAPPTPVAFYDAFLPALAWDAASLRDTEAFRATRRSIADMAASQHARGERFLLIYIPQKAELYWRWLSEDSKALIVSRLDQMRGLTDHTLIDANLHAQRDALAALARELDIEFLDLSVPLAAAIADGQMPYFFADTHWNQLGHNIARNALLAHLNRSTLE